MRTVRIPGYNEGSDIGGEPVNWLIYDPEVGTESLRIEWNPNYVPSPPPTRREELLNEIHHLQRELASLDEDDE